MPNPSNSKKELDIKKIAIAAAALILVILIIVFSVKHIKSKNKEEEETTAKTTVTEVQSETEPKVDYSSLSPYTGMPDYKAHGKRPVAIMINNSRPARPQWGLCTPDIVFEGVTEGGITRMLWLYGDVNSIPQKVGSTRSARHDFVEIAEGMDALFVHWGGSTYAYDAIKNRGVNDLDGLVYSGKLFFYDNTRNVSREHRGYTTRENLKKGFKMRGYRTDIKDNYSSPFNFTLPDKARTPMGGYCQSVYFEFSKYCNHSFKYNADTGLYYNYINGIAMNDANGNQMNVKNVLLLYCGISSMGDRAGCIDMDLSSGNGVFISNGGYEKITWEKGTAKSPIKLYNAEGKDLELNAGQSYIGLVPTSRQGTVNISE